MNPGMKKNRGQAYTEYVVVVMAVIMALLARDESGAPYVGRLITVIKQSYQGYASSIALPELPAKISK